MNFGKHPERRKRHFELPTPKENKVVSLFIVILLFLVVRFAMIESGIKIVHIPFLDDGIYWAIDQFKFFLWTTGFASNPP